MDVLFVVDLSGSNTKIIPDTNINNYDLIKNLFGELAENLNVAWNRTRLAYTPYAETYGVRADNNDRFDNLLVREIDVPDKEKVRNYLNHTMHQNVGSTGKILNNYFIANLKAVFGLYWLLEGRVLHKGEWVAVGLQEEKKGLNFHAHYSVHNMVLSL